jgi:hypothetical protein
MTDEGGHVGQRGQVGHNGHDGNGYFKGLLVYLFLEGKLTPLSENNCVLIAKTKTIDVATNLVAKVAAGLSKIQGRRMLRFSKLATGHIGG